MFIQFWPIWIPPIVWVYLKRKKMMYSRQPFSFAPNMWKKWFLLLKYDQILLNNTHFCSIYLILLPSLMWFRFRGLVIVWIFFRLLWNNLFKCWFWFRCAVSFVVCWWKLKDFIQNNRMFDIKLTAIWFIVLVEQEHNHRLN